jgi:hypothetical protein
MLLTAEQHTRIAAAYEAATADERVSPEDRAEFARKATWFRILASVAAKKEAAGIWSASVHHP